MSSPTLNGFTRDNLPIPCRRSSEPRYCRSRRDPAGRSPPGCRSIRRTGSRSKPVAACSRDRSSLDIDSPMKVTTSHGLVAEFLSAPDMTDGTIVSGPGQGGPGRLDQRRAPACQRAGRVIILEDTVRMTIVGGLDGWKEPWTRRILLLSPARADFRPRPRAGGRRQPLQRHQAFRRPADPDRK